MAALGRKSSQDAPRPLWAALLLLATPVIMFWRPYQPFFFIQDDWRALMQMTGLSFGQYLTTPNTEHWYPLSNLIYYGLIRAVGDHYSVLVLVNCLAAGAIAFLLYRFYRLHLPPGPALALGFFYALAGAHPATVWNSSYICFLLALGFFLGALWSTHRYLLAPSGVGLLKVGVCAGLSVLSNNFTLLGLAALPLYGALLGAGGARRRFWPLAAAVGLVYLFFGVGYAHFAGLPAAATLNHRVLSGLPGPAYLLHIFYGAVLAPFFYLFWGYYHFPIWAYVAGVTVLVLSSAAIWWWGTAREHRLGLWLLLLNLLPLLLVSLVRYQKSPDQAFVPRYAEYTLMGALLLVGTAWVILSRKLPPRPWAQTLLPVGFFALLVLGQVRGLPHWQQKYLEMSQASRNFYEDLARPGAGSDRPPEAEARKFLPWDYQGLTRGQALAVRRFLGGAGRGGEAPPPSGK
jgi:hypothetical protein